MSKKANPAYIGMFVIGAIVLCILGIMLFGSGQLFSKKEKFVLFFDDSVNGLEVGAPVKFMGVKIGQVTRITIRLENQKSDSEAVPVFVEIDMDRLENELGVDVDLGDPVVLRKQVDDFGLRARLQMQSLVTGLLFVELSYLGKDAPPFRYQQEKPKYREIPTVGSDIAKIFRRVEQTLVSISDIDFKAIGAHAESILAKVDKGVSEIEFKKINDSVVTAAQDVDKFLNDPELRGAIKSARQALEKGEHLMEELSSHIGPVTDDIRRGVVAFEKTMEDTQKMLETVQGAAAPNSPIRYEAEMALREVREAARSIKFLAEYLERNPNALLTGRDEQQQSE